MDKGKILKLISVCSQMDSVWVNGDNPGVGFQIAVYEMRKTLEQLLELRDEFKGS